MIFALQDACPKLAVMELSLNMEVVNHEYLGNPLWKYFSALLFLGLWFVVGLFARFVCGKAARRKRDKSGETPMATFYQALGKGLPLIGLAIGFRVAVRILTFPDNVEDIADTAAAVLVVGAFGVLVLRMVEVPLQMLRNHAAKESTRMDSMLVPLIGRTVKIVVIAVIVLQVFQVISGKDMTTILAGLGIASLAFGLAAQESIGNVFGSVFLFMNKPFEIGERCNIDGHDGVIKEVGLTCTRMERLDGHMVTIPNGQLYKKTIHNIGKRPFIRRIMNVTITYDTPPDKIEEAVKILRDSMKYDENDAETKINEPINQGDLLPRVYFNEFNADSLNIICIYWYQPPAYWDFLEHSQWLNLTIFRRFAEAGIDFAFPSQTIYLAGDDRRPINLPGFDGLASLAEGGGKPGKIKQIGDDRNQHPGRAEEAED